MIRASSYRTARTACDAPAAPTGGAQVFWGRGCGNELSFTDIDGRISRSVTGALRHALAVSALCLTPFAAGAAGAQTVDVPSGLSVTLQEVLLDETPGELWVRFRFLAPQIARALNEVSFETAEPDMNHLCHTLALPYLSQHTLSPARIVISLSDRFVPFGAMDAEATQFFETYRPEGDACLWEAF